MEKEAVQVDSLNTLNTEEQAQDNEQETTEKVELEKKYTEEDVDRIVRNRLARQQKKFEKILNPVETELDRREREITKRELRAEAKEKLSDMGLPMELAELCNLNDKEEFEVSFETVVNTFQSVFDKAIQDEITKRIKGHAPIRKPNPNHTGADLKGAFNSHR